ncbi:MAG: ABC transporter permease, partial [Nanoarchaeota archaeon]
MLTKKNLKLLVRAKSSALIVVFGPLLIILTLGLAFNTSDSYGIKVGVFANTYTDDVNSFITALEQDKFTVVKYERTIDQCVQDVKLNNVHACLTLPESFAIEGNTPKEITFHIDPSRINLVWVIQETVKQRFNLKAQEISQGLTGDLLTKLSDTKSKVSGETEHVTTIKERSNSAKTSSEAVKSSLSTIDLTNPATVYDFSVADTFKSTASARITDGKTKIDNAVSAVNSANLNATEKTKIKDPLAEAKKLIEDVNGLLAGVPLNASDNTTTTITFNDISTLMNQLKADIDTTKTKLTAASAAITSGVTTLDSVSASINEGISSLDSLQQVLNEITANLESQKVTEAGVIANPLVTKIERVSPEGTYLNYSFPALLVLVIMFSSLLLGTTLVMMEKHSPAFTRNFFLPLSKVSFILSTYLTNLILIAIQVVIIIGISLFFLPDSYVTFPFVGLVLFLAASVFTFLGMIIGYLFTSEETGVLASISLGSLLLFMSGVVLPLETMPALLQDVTSLNPFVVAEKLIREEFIFTSAFDLIWVDIL